MVSVPLFTPATPPLDAPTVTAPASCAPGANRPAPKTLVAAKPKPVLTLLMPNCSAPAPLEVFCTSRPVLAPALPTRKLLKTTGFELGVALPTAKTEVKPFSVMICVAKLLKLLSTCKVPVSAPPTLPPVKVTAKLPELPPAAMAPKLLAVTPVPDKRASMLLVTMAPRMSAPVPLLAI